jgi:DNA-directed RNA polymerase specialized sigma24 family protein
MTITVGDGPEFESIDPIDVLALEETLEELARLGERQCRVVEARCFAGLSIEETARALGISERTAKEDWTFARVWLDRRLTSGNQR